MNVRPRSTMFDSLYNLVSGLGSAKDKTMSNRYGLALLDRDQLESAYRGDWVARKVVDIPAKDATRAWRQWQATDPQIQKLEDEERRLDYRRKVKQAKIKARLYGGSAIVIGTGDSDPTKELDPESIGTEGIKYLHVVAPHNVTSGQINWDLTSPYYGTPEYYESQSVNGTVPVKIHPSRMIRFLGSELPDLQTTQNAVAGLGWGDSILQALDDAIKNVGATSQSVATMVAESKIDVVNVPNLMRDVSTEEYRSRFMERMSLANTSKSLFNMLVLDGEETWERIDQNFGGLPDVLKLYLVIACGAADIPASRFLSQSASGLNSTGESEIRNYYDHVSSDQETEQRPTLAPLDEMLIRSALGTRDPEIYYEWNPLWQLNQTERGAIAVQKANAFKVDFDAGLIDLDALRKGRENQLVEDGLYPGLESALEEVEATPLDENDPQTQAQFNVQNANKTKKPPVDPNAIDPKTGKPLDPAAKAVAALKVKVGADELFTGAQVREILDSLETEIADYSPDQPRERGGQDGGQWTSAGFTGSGNSDITKMKTDFTKAERAAVRDYKDQSYENWNRCLRKGSADSCKVKFPGGKDDDWGDNEAALSDLFTAVDKSTITKDAVVYRGIENAPGMDAESLRKSVGKKITLAGFTSTTRDRSVTENFGDRTVFEIYAPKGSKALSIGGMSEKELLLPHNSQFSVQSVLPNQGRKGSVVRLVYLGAKS